MLKVRWEYQSILTQKDHLSHMHAQLCPNFPCGFFCWSWPCKVGDMVLMRIIIECNSFKGFCPLKKRGEMIHPNLSVKRFTFIF